MRVPLAKAGRELTDQPVRAPLAVGADFTGQLVAVVFSLPPTGEQGVAIRIEQPATCGACSGLPPLIHFEGATHALASEA